MTMTHSLTRNIFHPFLKISIKKRFFVPVSASMARGRGVSRLWGGEVFVCWLWVVMTPGVTHVTSPVSICFSLATWQHDATSQTPTHHHNPIRRRHVPISGGGCACLPGYWSGNYNNTRHFATLGTNDWCRHRVVCSRTPRVNNRGQETWVTHAVTHGLLLITRPWCHCNLGKQK